VEGLLDTGVVLLRLVPMILAFYVPALIGTVIWKERGPGYKLQAGLWFAGGFGLIIFLYVVFASSSTPQVAATLGLSLVQIAAALTLARITAYKLAD
jgi:hypothetical protein